jgi:TolB protein
VCAFTVFVSAQGAFASFPGVNGKLAAAGGGFGADVFLVNIDGSDLVNLTNTLDSADAQPAFSPDGTQIALTHSPGLCCGDLRLSIMNADGTNLHAVSPTINFNSGDPSWAPGGQKIVLGGNADIFKIHADGKNLTPVITSPATESSPMWSPRGGQIAFLSNETGTRQVYVMNTDGSEVKQLTAVAGDINALDWSPDGRNFVYNVETSTGETIFVMDRNGSNPHMLFHSDGLGYVNPTWSPDGTKIAFLVTALDDPNHRDIWVMNAEGTNPHLAVAGWTPEINNIAWQPLRP